MPRLVFTFVRHGETKNNRERVLAGHLDTPLNSFGRRQAAAVALSPRLKETQFEYAFGSDLSRAVETAEAILEYHSSIPLVTTQRLRERYFGDAEGHPIGTRVRERGENLGEFQKRCIGWWKETVTVLMSENANDTTEGRDDSVADKAINVLVVTHGGFIRILFQKLVRDPQFRFENEDDLGFVPNTGVSVVEAVGVHDGRILAYADDIHLDGIAENDEELE